MNLDFEMNPAGLIGPYLHYDSNEWDGNDGVGKMPNLGTIGSSWDLEVQSYTSTPSGESTYRTHYCQIGNAFNYESKALTWEQLLGRPCTRPWTQMMAIKDAGFALDPNEPTHSGLVEDAEADLVFRDQETDSGNTDFSVGVSTAQGYDNSGDLGTKVQTTQSLDGSGSYGSGMTNANIPAGFPYNDTLLTISIDMAAGVGAVWVDQMKITNETSSVSEPLYVFSTDVPGMCSDVYDLYPSGPEWMFLFFGQHRTLDGATWTAGDDWTAIYGSAWFRGWPTAGDRLKWSSYWLP